MNYCYVLLCCLLFSWPCAAQQPTWEAYVIDPKITVRFPVAPEELNVPGTLAASNSSNKDSEQAQASQAFRAADATATYILVSVPLLTSDPRPGTTSEREEYYKNRSIPLLIQQMRGELLEQTVSATADLDSYTVKLRAVAADGSPGIKYVRVLTTDSRVYQLFFIPKDKTGETGITERAQFFETTMSR